MVVAEKSIKNGQYRAVCRLLTHLKKSAPDNGDAARSSFGKIGLVKCRLHGACKFRRRKCTDFGDLTAGAAAEATTAAPTTATTTAAADDEFDSEPINGSETEIEAEEAEEAVATVRGKHIHPCICDLTGAQRKKIEAYLSKMRSRQLRYLKRVKEIERELAKLEDERLEREREAMEQEELFGDEYVQIGGKRKRKKRSARRASMVSLGVKQVVNWRKKPRILVKSTRASALRCDYAKYCDAEPSPLPPVRSIIIEEEPKIKVRVTTTSSMRTRINYKKRKTLEANEDKRKPFIIPYFV